MFHCLQADMIFEVLKAYLKRAPSLKGAALVKLSQLKLQINPWHVLSNLSRISAMMDGVEISSDNWFENVLRIYQTRVSSLSENEIYDGNHTA